MAGIVEQQKAVLPLLRLDNIDGPIVLGYLPEGRVTQPKNSTDQHAINHDVRYHHYRLRPTAQAYLLQGLPRPTSNLIQALTLGELNEMRGVNPCLIKVAIFGSYLLGRLPSPVAIVYVNQPAQRLHFEPTGLGNGLGGLKCSPQRAGI